jgi:transcriptional regulator NrdR family protein
MSPRLSRGQAPKPTELGIRCPKCGHGKQKVLFIRDRKYGHRRRLECLNEKCGFRFPTKETVVQP